jgi:hypothetical protein
MKVKSIAETVAKWVSRARVAVDAYLAGIASPRQPWAAAATAAAKTWADAITAAIAAKRYEKGIAKAGDAKWLKNSTELGGARFAPGVAAAETTYANAFAPYLAVLAGLTLPPRYPKGDVRNINRVAAIADALHKKAMA